jgi:hypothetical protein
MSATELEPPKSAPALVVVSTADQQASASDGDSDANSTPPATPIFQPSALHPEPTVLVLITSYAHAPPLQPAPDLQYDLRQLPSPGAEKYASKYDGRGKRAREWVNGEGVYVELLGTVEKAVLKRGRELEQEAAIEKAERERAEREKDEREKAEAEKTTGGTKDETPSVSAPEAPERPVEELVNKTEALEIEETEDPSPVSDGTSPKVLRVGVSSEMGRDRSVAFVEQLGRKQWPIEWAVEVLHRDVDRQRGLRKGKARGGEKGGRRKNLRGGDFGTDE